MVYFRYSKIKKQKKMKYFIAGREIHSDKNYEAGSLNNYYELGWEVISTHLLAKRLINTNKLNTKEDVVVTCSGREFLYSKQIKTISWKEFEEIKKYNIVTEINSIEFYLTANFFETKDFGDLYITDSEHKYRFFDEDYDLITNLDYNFSIIPDNKFICMNRRKRKHREHLNMSDDYSLGLVQNLIKKYNVPIYMTGFHNEIFEKIPNVHLVNLKDWCSLLNSENCLFCIQNQTGTANLTQLCAKQNLLNVILDMEGAHFMPIYANGRRPDVLGKSVNFKNTKNLVFYRTPEHDDILNEVIKYVKP
jgi:hypothetical protein